jgi:DNA gyrase inhibitor GyrI
MIDQTNSQNIRIVNLEPMRVASIYAFGANPELEAWKKLTDWAQPGGRLENFPESCIFGFNNPEPSDENSEYGYEIWIKIGPEIKPEGDIRIVEFHGGPYAVSRCEVLGEPSKNIPAGWQNLAEWCNKNNHNFGYHAALERFITRMDEIDKLVLDLYCPIIE